VILADIDIHTLARRELVTPFDPELVNPASLDVRLGKNLLMEQEEHPALLPYSIAGATQEKPFLALPAAIRFGRNAGGVQAARLHCWAAGA
jgi:dCTP deaminase